MGVIIAITSILQISVRAWLNAEKEDCISKWSYRVHTNIYNNALNIFLRNPFLAARQVCLQPYTHKCWNKDKNPLKCKAEYTSKGNPPKGLKKRRESAEFWAGVLAACGHLPHSNPKMFSFSHWAERPFKVCPGTETSILNYLYIKWEKRDTISLSLNKNSKLNERVD